MDEIVGLDVLDLYSQAISAERSRRIKLSHRGLSKVPAHIMATENLLSLHLDSNKLTVLPTDLTFECTSTLQALVLSNNLLVSLPPEICRCSALTDLKVGNNQLTSLPDMLGHVLTLEKIHASGNRIASVPPTMSMLQNLQLLDLSRNRLSHFPDEQLWMLTDLTELSLASNQLSSLPVAIACLNRLRILSASGNMISELIPDIVKLPCLEEMYLSNNQLRMLPGPCWRKATRLVTLELSGNPLVNLPHQLGYLSQLQLLGISRCPELAPRLAQAMHKGLDAMIVYMLALKPEIEVEEDHVSAVEVMHRERKARRKQALNELVSGQSGMNDGVSKFYRDLLALSAHGEDEDVKAVKERIAKRMNNHKPQ